MPHDASSRPPLLEMRGISKTFPGVRALNDGVCRSIPAKCIR